MTNDTRLNRVNVKSIISLLGGAALLAGLGSCSSAPRSDLREASQPPGPAIIAPRVSMPVIDLSPDLKRVDSSNVLVDVKDPGSEITSVMLQLHIAPTLKGDLGDLKTPFEVPMKHIKGTTWSAHLSNDDLKRLGVSGQDLSYEGTIIARNKAGGVSVSPDSVEFTIRAAPVEGSS